MSLRSIPSFRALHDSALEDTAEIDGARQSRISRASSSASAAAFVGGGIAALRRAVRPRGGFWGPHSVLGVLTLVVTLVYFAYLLSPSPSFYPFGAPRIVDVERHFGIAGYRLLLWSTAALSCLGLLRLPGNDPEVRKNFFRFQCAAALYGSFVIETGVTRTDAVIDVFSGPGQLVFLLLSGGDFAIALYWLYTIVAVDEKDGDVVAGVQQRSMTSVLAAAVGPIVGASGLLVPPVFMLLAGEEANARFLAANPSIEAATLNATVGLILIGNLAVLCLTATRRRWLTNNQALPLVLAAFFLGFYDLLAYAASDQERQAALNVLNSKAYGLHLPEALLIAVVATAALGLLHTPRRQ